MLFQMNAHNLFFCTLIVHHVGCVGMSVNFVMKNLYTNYIISRFFKKKILKSPAKSYILMNPEKS